MPTVGGDGRVHEVLGHDIELVDRGDLRRDAGHARARRIEDRVVPAWQEAERQHAKAYGADRHREHAKEAPAPNVGSRARGGRIPTQLQHHAIDREQGSPDQRSRNTVREPEKAAARDGQQNPDNYDPADRSKSQGRMLRMPDAARPAPGRSQHSKANHHGDDQPHLLHDLARVLKRVDKKSENEPRHHSQEGLVQQLRERFQAQQEVCQVHQGHEHNAREHAPSHAAKCCLSASGCVAHVDWFTT